MAQFAKKCPECGGLNLLWNRAHGEVTCRDCGLVIEEKMVDFGQEWRDFDDAQGQRRAGAPMTYTQYDRGLGTEVGTRADLSKLAQRDRSKFFRLRKWQYRVSTAIERNLKMALAEMKRVSSYLRLPGSVDEEAARIYTQAVQRGLVRGRSMESVVAGVLYAACRRNEVPRTLDEISEASGIDKKEIGRTYRFITRELAQPQDGARGDEARLLVPAPSRLRGRGGRAHLHPGGAARTGAGEEHGERRRRCPVRRLPQK